MAHVDLQKYSSHPDGYTEYFIIVSFLGGKWSIKRRYSDFVALNEYCEQHHLVISATLPARNWWQRFDPYVLQQRQKDLQHYLDAVLQVSTPNDNEALAKFLEVDKHIERNDYDDDVNEPIKSEKHLDYHERLRIIVKDFRNNILIAPNRPTVGGRYAGGSSNPRRIPDNGNNNSNNGNGIASSSGSGTRSGANSGGNSFSDSFARTISNTVFSRSKSNNTTDIKSNNSSSLSRNNSGHGAGTTPTGPSSFENGLYSSSRNNGKIRRMNTTDTDSAAHGDETGCATGGTAAASVGGGISSILDKSRQQSQTRKESSSMFSREGTPGLSQSGAGDHAVLAADVIRKQRFLTYMSNTYREYENHVNLHINSYDRPDPSPTANNDGARTLSTFTASPLKPPASTSSKLFSSGGNNSNSSSSAAKASKIRGILSADLDLDDIEYTLDECADHILEATMSHYNLTMSYSSNASVSTARGSEASHIVVNDFHNPFPTKHDGDHKAYSRSGSGSKYSYFNKEFKRLSANDKLPSSGHEIKVGSFKPPSRGQSSRGSTVAGSLVNTQQMSGSMSGSLQAETAFFHGPSSAKPSPSTTACNSPTRRSNSSASNSPTRAGGSAASSLSSVATVQSSALVSAPVDSASASAIDAPAAQANGAPPQL